MMNLIGSQKRGGLVAANGDRGTGSRRSTAVADDRKPANCTRDIGAKSETLEVVLLFITEFF